MERLSVLCFAGTYGLALVSELARVLVKGSMRWYVTLGLTALGWIVQTAYLANLGWVRGRLPVATPFESLLVVTWLLGAIALYLMMRAPKPVAVGLFVLPLVVVLSVVAGLSGPRENWGDWGGRTVFWGRVHGLLLLAGSVSSCVAFVAGLMYLAQARRLKRKSSPRFGFSLPSLEQSERLNRGAITLAFPLLTGGLFIGLALVATTSAADGPLLKWSDPKILSTGVMWLVFAVLLHARYRVAMRGRRMMILTLIAFGFLVFTLVGVDLFLPTAHGGGAAPRRVSGGAAV